MGYWTFLSNLAVAQQRTIPRCYQVQINICPQAQIIKNLVLSFEFEPNLKIKELDYLNIAVGWQEFRIPAAALA